jgi:RNA polymerase sigma-70 factor (ECF subfamily)
VMTEPTQHSLMPDEALMQAVARGDALAFAELFRRHRGQVYRFVLHMSAVPSLAEDVTQDVFLQVMQDAARFDAERGSVGPWLFGFARNLLRRRFERETKLQPLMDDDSSGEIEAIATREDTLGDLTRAERIETLRRAILTLPLRYREPVVLCDLHEISYVDAAAAIGCAVGTVRSRLHRGRALLAAKMSALEEIPASTGSEARPDGRGGAKCFA